MKGESLRDNWMRQVPVWSALCNLSKSSGWLNHAQSFYLQASSWEWQTRVWKLCKDVVELFEGPFCWRPVCLTRKSNDFLNLTRWRCIFRSLNFSALEHEGHDDSAHQQLPHRRSAEVYGPGTQAVLPSDLDQGPPTATNIWRMSGKRSQWLYQHTHVWSLMHPNLWWFISPLLVKVSGKPPYVLANSIVCCRCSVFTKRNHDFVQYSSCRCSWMIVDFPVDVPMVFPVDIPHSRV